MSSGDIKLSTFPSSRVQALTMLYLERQDLSDLTPSELVEKYLEVEKEIKQAFPKKKQQQRITC